MRAMLLKNLASLDINPEPLELAECPEPEPAANEVLIRVHVCGVCHTELDEIEGRTPPPRLPIIPGHQVVGCVEKLGRGVDHFKIGDRVGVGWIYSACGECSYCRRGEENLCPHYQATGRDAHGGYAELMKVPAPFAVRIPEIFTDIQAAPLLCAGAVGYRSLKLAKHCDGQNLGFTGFGASAHLVMQLARYLFPKSQMFAFARSKEQRDFAIELGAVWAGDTAESSPEKLHAIIDTTPAWTPIIEALKNLEPGGRLVINAIRKEITDIGALLKLNYAQHLWMEKEIKSVANVTCLDISECLRLAAEASIRPEIEEYALEDANRALFEIKQKSVRGAKVLRISTATV